jgi:GNAT superfamily N-acetyltransferase
MSVPSWSLRPAAAADREFLLDLHRLTMREAVECVWAWDDEQQAALFDERFVPGAWEVIEAEGVPVGVLWVEDRDGAVFVRLVEILPEWQGRGLGSAVVRSVMQAAAADARPVALRVLHANPRARALYERLGFAPYDEIETHTYLRWEAD